MTTIETLAVKLIGDVTDFNDKMMGAANTVQAVGDKMTAAGDKLQAMGQKWSLFISAPLIAVGKDALQSAADFEVSMNVMEKVTGATADQMAAMSKQALQLGKDTIFGAGEAAKAQLELAKAGMDVNQTMAAMPGVLDLAAAGGVDLAYAAKLTAGALNAFSLDAAESTRVANLLAAAANASAADIGDLSLGFQQGGFAFAAANQKVDDLAASLAILTNVGLKGTDAGTALKNMFTQLYGPTQKAKDTMDAYGIEIFDATGTMKPLVDIIAIFNEKLGGLSQEQRLAALDAILLSDGMKAMIPLMSAGADGFLAMKDAVNEQGAASSVAEARMGGLSGAIEYFKGTIDTLMIQTATPWLDQLGAIIRTTADWIAKFGELDPAVQKNIVIMAALVAAVGPVLIYAGLLISSTGSLISALGALSAFILANPITALIALAAATVVFAVAWSENWGGVQEKTRAAIDFIRNYISDNYPIWRDKLLEWGDAAWTWIRDVAYPKAKEQLSEWWAWIYSYVSDNYPIWRDKLIEWGNAAWMWIRDVAYPATVTALGDLWTLFSDWVQGNYPIWRDKLIEWGNAAWTWIVDAAPKAMAKIGQWTGDLLKWMVDRLPEWWATLIEWETAAVEWIGESLPKAITAFGEWVRAIVGWGNADGRSQLVVMTGEWVNALTEWVVTKLIPVIGPELRKLSTAIISALWEVTKAIAGAAWDIGVGIMQGIIDGIANGWQALKDAAKDAAKGALDAAKQALGIASPSKEGVKIGENFGASIGAGTQGAIGAIRAEQWLGDSLPVVLAALNEWINQVTTWGNNAGYEKIAAMAARYADALLGWIEDKLIPLIGPQLAQFGDSVHGLLSRIAADMPALGQVIGRNIVDGMIEGIRRGWDALAASAREVASGALDAAKRALGIASPSKEGIKIGKNFGESIGMGARAAIGQISVDATLGVNSLLNGASASTGTKRDAGLVDSGQELTARLTKLIDNLSAMVQSKIERMAGHADQMSARIIATINQMTARADAMLRTIEAGATAALRTLSTGAQADARQALATINAGAETALQRLTETMASRIDATLLDASQRLQGKGDITINLSLTIAGNGDAGAVTRAAQDGLLLALRQVGY